MLGANTTIEVWRASAGSTRDAEGRKVTTWTLTATVTGFVTSTSRRELTEGQWVVVEDLRALLPVGTQVGHRDELRADGQRYRVEGATVRKGPLGPHHVRCDLTRVVS